MNIGHTIRLSRIEVEQAIKRRAREVAEAKGIKLPIDGADFENRATPHFVDAAGAPIDGLAAVVVTWED